MSDIVIDLDADPHLPEGLIVVTVEEHQPMGEFEWDPKKVQLYRSQKQENGSFSRGEQLREELKSKKPFNANLLDWLLKYQHLIPEEWKEVEVCFWGTIYRDLGGELYVRCLVWDGSWWWSFPYWVDDDFDFDYPAACFAA